MTGVPKLDVALEVLAKEAWLAATTAQQEFAAKEGARILEGFEYKGERATAHQGLSWPRSGAFRPDGSAVTGVPPEIVEANIILAGLYLVHAGITPAGLAHVRALIADLLKV